MYETVCFLIPSSEFRKKMELARLRISTLQKKQKETEKMAAITGQTDRK